MKDFLTKNAERLRNALFALILILFFTGGLWYRGSIFGHKIFIELSQLDPVVLAFLILVGLGVYRQGAQTIKNEWWFLKFSSVFNAAENLQNRRYVSFAVIASLTFSVVIFIVAARRHLAFDSNAYDLGVMYDPLFNTLQGRFNHSSLLGHINRFQNHVELISFLYLPILKLIPSPLVLLFTQSFALGLAAIPLALIARKKLDTNSLRLAVLISFLGSFSLRSIALFDYHHVALVVPFFLAAFYFIDEEKIGWGLLFLFAALMCKETVALPVIFLGAVFLITRRYRIGAATIAMGIAVFAFDTKAVPVLFDLHYRQFDLYAHLGSSMKEVVLSPLLNTKAFLAEIFEPDALLFVYRLFGPVMFLCVLAPLFLLPCFPVFMYLALAPGSQKLGVTHHYAAEFLPFIYYALILALAKIEKRYKQGRPIFKGRFISPKTVAYLLVAATFLFYGRSEVAKFRMHTMDSHKDLLYAVMEKQIPPDASVITNSCIVPHLMNREKIYMIPRLRENVDFVLLDQKMCLWPMKENEVPDFVASSDRSKNYKRVFSLDGIILWKRVDETMSPDKLP